MGTRPLRGEAEQAEAERLILEFLAVTDAPVTEAELDVVSCRTQPKRAALRTLVAAGKVARAGCGGKADPFRYSCSLSIVGNKGTETASLDPSAEHDREDSCSRVPHGVVVPMFPPEQQ